jgi:hypothetical protein
MDDCMVHFKTSEHTLYFAVYPVSDWTSALNGETGTSYTKKGSCDLVDEFNENECQKDFEGSFCWRGVWEGRLYFTDYEYWGEDIQEMSDLYNNQIVPWCKAFIENRDGEKHE